MWDVSQYSRFQSERTRPFFDLVGQVRAESPARVVDLGCGTGELTRTLADRWPRAIVLGIDSSPQMLAESAKFKQQDRVEFLQQDIADWSPAEPVDVIISNAALQWLPRHDELVTRLASFLTPGGVLAVQMPNRFRTASQRAIEDAMNDPRWRERMAGVGLHQESVQPLEEYTRLLMRLGCSVNAWETTYMHILPGKDGVLEWLEGTGLRPLLATLDPLDKEAFRTEVGARLRRAYPSFNGATLFPMPRLFFVATRA
jgi:trans-aconitate 2-methyltransferase